MTRRDGAGVETGDRPLILVADDDPHIVELVSLFLARAGYEVATARDGREALHGARELHPALVVLDVMMPGPDGLEVCQALRRSGDTPVILLTARSGDIDKIAGLRFGADDYVTKPFNPEELVARIEAVLRRAGAPRPQGASPSAVQLGALTVDLGAREARGPAGALPLTPKEFELLAAFARLPNLVLDRDQLLDLAWGSSHYAVRTVDVHVARLREKLSGLDVEIETVWGTGYRMRART